LKTKELLELNQKVLETVIPTVGDKIVVIRGKHKGRSAKVLQKEKEKAVVQFTSDFSSEQLHFDDICHYTGSDIHE
jgi:hypothetical protein